MQGRDDAEMTLVERQETRRPVAGGEGDERAVGETEVEIGVLRLQLEHRRVVVAFEAPDGEARRGEIAQERPPGGRTEAPAEEVIDLGGRRSGHYQRSGFGCKHRENRVALWLSGIGQRDERR